MEKKIYINTDGLKDEIKKGNIMRTTIKNLLSSIETERPIKERIKNQLIIEYLFNIPVRAEIAQYTSSPDLCLWEGVSLGEKSKYLTIFSPIRKKKKVFDIRENAFYLEQLRKNSYRAFLRSEGLSEEQIKRKIKKWFY